GPSSQRAGSGGVYHGGGGGKVRGSGGCPSSGRQPRKVNRRVGPSIRFFGPGWPISVELALGRVGASVGLGRGRGVRLCSWVDLARGVLGDGGAGPRRNRRTFGHAPV